jgi:hypothetical protein
MDFSDITVDPSQIGTPAWNKMMSMVWRFTFVFIASRKKRVVPVVQSTDPYYSLFTYLGQTLAVVANWNNENVLTMTKNIIKRLYFGVGSMYMDNIPDAKLIFIIKLAIKGMVFFLDDPRFASPNPVDYWFTPDSIRAQLPQQA